VPLSRLRASLSDRDLAILHSVSDLRFLTARQLQVLHFDGDHHTPLTAARTCRRVLERLSDLGVLRRLDRVIGGVRAGSGSFVYGLGPAGHRLLADGRARHGFREPSLTFLDHTLAVAGLLTTIVGAAKRDDLQLVRHETEPAVWRSVPGYGTAETLRPDLLLVVARGAMEWHWFVEVDLASEHGPAVARKCRQYLRYYQSGREQALHEIFPKVAWLTTTSRRADQLRTLTREVAGDLPLFEVGLLGEPLPVLLPDEGVR
jgi:hypothetical protein